MDQVVVTYQQLLGVLAALVGLFIAFLSWSVKAQLNRMDRDEAEQRGRMDRVNVEVLDRIDDFKAEVLAQLKHSDKKGEERHRENQAVLRDLSYRLGRLEGRSGVHDDAPNRSRRHSPRRRGDPSTASDSEPDPAEVAKFYDESKVPLAGVRAESAHAASLAHQAVPDQEQGGETAPEPCAGESTDEAQ